MFDFRNINSPISITTDWLLSKIDEFTIFRFYFGDFKVGKAYNSVFTKDNKPSTGFYISKTGRLYYNDMRTNEKWNCFTFVQQLYNCSFHEALQRIASDFGLLNLESKIVTDDFLVKVSNEEREYKKNNLIQFSYQPFTKEAINFWRYYEITHKELIENKIFLVSKLFLNKREIYNTNNTLRFAYPLSYRDDENRIINAVKIYSPLDLRMKWLSTIPNSVPFGYYDLPHNSDTLIITKSKKDHVVLKKLFTDVMSVQNESENAFPIFMQEQVLKDYKKCIIIFDNDDPGVDACKKFNSKGFLYFNIPKVELENKIKDPSDYIKAYGEYALRELFIKKGICPNIS